MRQWKVFLGNTRERDIRGSERIAMRRSTVSVHSMKIDGERSARSQRPNLYKRSARKSSVDSCRAFKSLDWERVGAR